MDVILLGLMVVVGSVVAGIILVGALLLRAILWVVLLPFRILFAIFFFPFWIAKTVLKLAAMVVLAPILLLLGMAGLALLLVTAVASVLVPLVPILLVAALVWLFVRAVSGRPATT
jgi:hypothetical protein